MVTGVECAGLVLAILPLLVEAAKAYNAGVEDIRGVIQKDRQNVMLQEFYEDFLIEVTFVNRNMERVLDALPDLLDSQKTQLKAEFQQQLWLPTTEVAKSLSSLFGNQYGAFEMTISKIMRLFGKVVNDEMLNISAAEVSVGYAHKLFPYLF